MRYTKPQILRIDEAISIIQQIDDTGTNKTGTGFLDSHDPKLVCSASAYQADE